MHSLPLVTGIVVVIFMTTLSLYGADRPAKARSIRSVSQLAPVVADTTAVATHTSQTSPVAGETIDWFVLAGGGTDMTSGSTTISGTLGQTFVGSTTAASNEVLLGFWQNFSCCTGTRGNVDQKGIIDLSDLSLLIDYMVIIPRRELPCPDAANVNALGIVDLSDLSLLISYLVDVPPPTLPNCP